MQNKIATFKAPLLLATIGVAVASGVAAAAEPTVPQLHEIVVQSPVVSSEYSPWSRSRVERYRDTVRVTYADLNLADNAGVTTLNARVKTAAGLACQRLGDLTPVDWQKCVDNTVASTQPRLQAVVTAAMQAAVTAKQEPAQS